MRTPEERRQFVFLQWCLQEAPGSPASPLRSIHVLLTLTFSSATYLSIKPEGDFLVFFLPLDTKLHKIGFSNSYFSLFFLQAWAIGLLPQTCSLELGTTASAAWVRVSDAHAVCSVLLLDIQRFVSLSNEGNFLPGEVGEDIQAFGGFLLFSPTNKLQHLYKYTCNFSYDLSQNVPVPTCQIYTFLNRF